MRAVQGTPVHPPVFQNLPHSAELSPVKLQWLALCVFVCNCVLHFIAGEVIIFRWLFYFVEHYKCQWTWCFLFSWELGHFFNCVNTNINSFGTFHLHIHHCDPCNQKNITFLFYCVWILLALLLRQRKVCDLTLWIIYLTSTHPKLSKNVYVYCIIPSSLFTTIFFKRPKTVRLQEPTVSFYGVLNELRGDNWKNGTIWNLRTKLST